MSEERNIEIVFYTSGGDLYTRVFGVISDSIDTIVNYTKERILEHVGVKIYGYDIRDLSISASALYNSLKPNSGELISIDNDLLSRVRDHISELLFLIRWKDGYPSNDREIRRIEEDLRIIEKLLEENNGNNEIQKRDSIRKRCGVLT